MAIGSVTADWEHASQAAATTNVEYTSKVRSLDLSFEREMVEATNFADASHEYEAGLKDAEISVVYAWDSTIDDILRDIYDNGTAVTWEYSPNGATAAEPRVTGSAHISSLGIPEGIGELQTISATFKVTGAVTFDVQP